MYARRGLRGQGDTICKSGKCKGENAAAFVNDVYERFQWKEQTDCGYRFRGCLRQSPFQAADGPAHPIWNRSTLTRWIAGALLERTVVICSSETGALLFLSSQQASYHKDHCSRRSSSVYTPKNEAMRVILGTTKDTSTGPRGSC